MSLIDHINIKPKIEGERGLPKRQVKSAFFDYGGLQGDFNRYRTEKKGNSLDMAVLLLPTETINWLNEEGWPVQPGDLGENITTLGIPYTDFNPGDRFNLGNVQVEITDPCYPCTNLNILPYVGERLTEFMEILLSGEGETKEQRNRRGWYARVIVPGRVYTGDAIRKLQS